MRTRIARHGGVRRMTVAGFGAACLAVTIVNAGATPAGAAPAGGPAGHAAELRPPSNAAASGGTVQPDAISCPVARACVIGGGYAETSQFRQAMAVTQAGGRWRRGVEVAAPAGAAANPGAQIEGLRCFAIGSCVGVGIYSTGAGEGTFAVAERGGVWGQASGLPLPANAAAPPQAELFGLSCTSAGSCVASGNYADTSGRRDGMITTSSRGRRASAIGITPPRGSAANPNMTLASVACTGLGSCVAAGNYTNGSGVVRGTEVNEVRGHWRRAVQSIVPRNAAPGSEAFLDAVTCTGAGACVAVGTYTDRAGHLQGMAVTEAGGRWLRAAEIPAPADAAANPDTVPAGISCIRTGFCAAAGIYDLSATHRLAVVADEVNGRWQRGLRVSSPRNAQSGANGFSVLAAVACLARHTCVASGAYADGSGNEQGVAVTLPLP